MLPSFFTITWRTALFEAALLSGTFTIRNANGTGSNILIITHSSWRFHVHLCSRNEYERRLVSLAGDRIRTIVLGKHFLSRRIPLVSAWHSGVFEIADKRRSYAVVGPEIPPGGEH